MWILNIMNGIQDPSMVVQTSAVRRAKRGMADSRAMAEQHERMNPVNPKRELMRNKNGVAGAEQTMGLDGGFHMVYLPASHSVSYNGKAPRGRGMAGGSATPSMGLSQFRGGKKHTLIDHMEHPMEGFGTKKGQMRLTARKAYEPSEAHLMGQHLSKHIHDLHGAGFWSDFGNGFKQGFMGVMKPALALGSLLPGQIGMASKLGTAGINALGMGHTEEQRAVAQLSKKKVGRSRNNGVPLLSGNVNGVVSGGSMEGCGDTGAYEGHGLLGQPGHGTLRTGGYGADGHGQQKAKRMVGAGVRARADLVRKVMAEQGLKMIDASKYVKEHGLY